MAKINLGLIDLTQPLSVQAAEALSLYLLSLSKKTYSVPIDKLQQKIDETEYTFILANPLVRSTNKNCWEVLDFKQVDAGKNFFINRSKGQLRIDVENAPTQLNAMNISQFISYNPSPKEVKVINLGKDVDGTNITDVVVLPAGLRQTTTAILQGKVELTLNEFAKLTVNLIEAFNERYYSTTDKNHPLQLAEIIIDPKTFEVKYCYGTRQYENNVSLRLQEAHKLLNQLKNISSHIKDSPYNNLEFLPENIDDAPMAINDSIKKLTSLKIPAKEKREEKNQKDATNVIKKEIGLIDFEKPLDIQKRRLLYKYIDYLEKRNKDFPDPGTPITFQYTNKHNQTYEYSFSIAREVYKRPSDTHPGEFRYEVMRKASRDQASIEKNKHEVIEHGGFGALYQNIGVLSKQKNHTVKFKNTDPKPHIKNLKKRITKLSANQELAKNERLYGKNVSYTRTKEPAQGKIIVDDAKTIPTFLNAMLFIHGSDLYTFLQKNSLLENQAIQIAINISYNLFKYHSQDLIHGDIKPENFMVKNLQTKLIDFGTMKKTHEMGDPSLGTTGFLAPEIENQKGKDNVGTTTATDIYALGKTFYEVFGVENIKNPEILRLIQHMTNDNPDKRPNINEVINKLNEYQKKHSLKSDTEKQGYDYGVYVKTLISQKPDITMMEELIKGLQAPHNEKEYIKGFVLALQIPVIFDKAESKGDLLKALADVKNEFQENTQKLDSFSHLLKVIYEDILERYELENDIQFRKRFDPIIDQIKLDISYYFEQQRENQNDFYRILELNSKFQAKLNSLKDRLKTVKNEFYVSKYLESRPKLKEFTLGVITEFGDLAFTMLSLNLDDKNRLEYVKKNFHAEQINNGKKLQKAMKEEAEYNLIENSKMEEEAKYNLIEDPKMEEEAKYNLIENSKMLYNIFQSPSIVSLMQSKVKKGIVDPNVTASIKNLHAQLNAFLYAINETKLTLSQLTHYQKTFEQQLSEIETQFRIPNLGKIIFQLAAPENSQDIHTIVYKNNIKRAISDYLISTLTRKNTHINENILALLNILNTTKDKELSSKITQKLQSINNTKTNRQLVNTIKKAINRDRVIEKRNVWTINPTKKMSSEERRILWHLFTQNKNKEVFEKNGVYKVAFINPKNPYQVFEYSFSLSHTIYSRPRSSEKHEKRFDVIANGDPLGKGSYGTVAKLEGTLILEKNQKVRLKNTNPDKKDNLTKRVTKVTNVTETAKKGTGKILQGQETPEERQNKIEEIENKILEEVQKEFESLSKFSNTGAKPPVLDKEATLVSIKSGEFEPEYITEKGKKSYLTLKFAGKVSLQNFYDDIKSGKIQPTIKELLTISANLCRNLEEIHEQNVVHRDIKLENIMIDPKTLQTQFIDFGASRLQGEEPFIRGTPMWASVEQLSRAPANFASDYYLLGQLLANLWGMKSSKEKAVGSFFAEKLNEIENLNLDQQKKDLKEKIALEEKSLQEKQKKLDEEYSDKYKKAKDNYKSLKDSSIKQKIQREVAFGNITNSDSNLDLNINNETVSLKKIPSSKNLSLDENLVKSLNEENEKLNKSAVLLQKEAKSILVSIREKGPQKLPLSEFGHLNSLKKDLKNLNTHAIKQQKNQLNKDYQELMNMFVKNPKKFLEEKLPILNEDLKFTNSSLTFNQEDTNKFAGLQPELQNVFESMTKVSLEDRADSLTNATTFFENQLEKLNSKDNKEKEKVVDNNNQEKILESNTNNIEQLKNLLAKLHALKNNPFVQENIYAHTDYLIAKHHPKKEKWRYDRDPIKKPEIKPFRASLITNIDQLIHDFELDLSKREKAQEDNNYKRMEELNAKFDKKQAFNVERFNALDKKLGLNISKNKANANSLVDVLIEAEKEITTTTKNSSLRMQIKSVIQNYLERTLTKGNITAQDRAASKRRIDDMTTLLYVANKEEDEHLVPMLDTVLQNMRGGFLGYGFFTGKGELHTELTKVLDNYFEKNPDSRKVLDDYRKNIKSHKQ